MKVYNTIVDESIFSFKGDDTMNGKKLYKSRSDRMIAGVCGGIGEYFNIDPTVVRVATAILFFSGVGLPAYIVAAIIMPENY